MPSKPDRVALAGLMTGALVWGLIWYPYRVLEHQGLSGLVATLATYTVALVGGGLLFRRAWGELFSRPLLIPIALAAGGCNLGYVLGMLSGEVMRVLLLFYLAPLWTVPLARLLLGERLRSVGVAVTALSLAGAAVMLWRPEAGLPLPGNRAEWFGLAAGFLFALTNVLSRRAAHFSEEAKSLAMFLGVIVLGGGAFILESGPSDLAPLTKPAVAGLILLVGLLLFAVNMAVQYGLSLTRANQAALILLLELVVAAFGAWLLAGETMTLLEWLGGAMIAAASLLSVKLEGSQA